MIGHRLRPSSYTGSSPSYADSSPPCLQHRDPDVLELTVDDARNASVRNKLDGVLEDGSETNGFVDLGLFLGGKVDTFSVASTLDVEDTVV